MENLGCHQRSPRPAEEMVGGEVRPGPPPGHLYGHPAEVRPMGSSPMVARYAEGSAEDAKMEGVGMKALGLDGWARPIGWVMHGSMSGESGLNRVETSSVLRDLECSQSRMVKCLDNTKIELLLGPASRSDGRFNPAQATGLI